MIKTCIKSVEREYCRGLDISARPLAQASVKTVGRVQITDHSPGLANTIFCSSCWIFHVRGRRREVRGGLNVNFLCLCGARRLGE